MAEHPDIPNGTPAAGLGGLGWSRPWSGAAGVAAFITGARAGLAGYLVEDL